MFVTVKTQATARKTVETDQCLAVAVADLDEAEEDLDDEEEGQDPEDDDIDIDIVNPPAAAGFVTFMGGVTLLLPICRLPFFRLPTTGTTLLCPQETTDHGDFRMLPSTTTLHTTRAVDNIF